MVDATLVISRGNDVYNAREVGLWRGAVGECGDAGSVFGYPKGGENHHESRVPPGSLSVR